MQEVEIDRALSSLLTHSFHYSSFFGISIEVMERARMDAVSIDSAQQEFFHHSISRESIDLSSSRSESYFYVCKDKKRNLGTRE